jgi:hypothetical protein
VHVSLLVMAIGVVALLLTRIRRPPERMVVADD